MPSRCRGTLTWLTIAPAPARVSIAARTVSSTSGWDRPGKPNPSATTPTRSPVAPASRPDVKSSGGGGTRWRGSSPSGPATTPSISAASPTVRAIRPRWAEGVLDRDRPRVGARAVRRLVPDGAAEGAGNADRAALVTAEREVNLAGRDQRGAPA